MSIPRFLPPTLLWAFLLIRYTQANATTFMVTVGPSGNLVFSPSTVNIKVGDTVQWTWGSSFHSSTSGTPGNPDGMWDSTVLLSGQTFSFTFMTAGTFNYYCTPHGSCCGMVGEVVVSSANPTGNTFYGDGAGANTTGSDNSGFGDSALSSNTTGSDNTAAGFEALYGNTTGGNNTAVGNSALQNNTAGGSNIAIGSGAGANLTTGSNNIDIGHPGLINESKKIRIGTTGTQKATFIAGISGVTIPNGVAVIVNPAGQLGTVVSSARYKKNIQPMGQGSEKILSLHPVTFEYKEELDPQGIPQFGLVAEDVAKVDPDLVARDDEGKPCTVRYEAVNATLLNEFLKEHKKVEEQIGREQKLEATVAEQQKEIQALTAALKAQAAQLQKVSDQLATEAHTPRVVANK